MKSTTRIRGRLAQLAAVGMVATVTAVSPSSPAAGAPPAEAGPAAGGDHNAVPGELLVGYDAGATDADRAQARGRSEAVLAERVVAGNGATAEVELVRLPPGKDRAAAARDIEADPAVAYAEPNWIYTHTADSNDPYFTDGSLWGMYGNATNPANDFGSQAGEAWAAGNTGSASVYVGVIDEGIQFTHPDLSGQVWTNPFDPADGEDNDGNGYVDDIRGWDFANNDNTIYDGGTKGNLDDHGTHVAGTIGAKADGSGVVGVNWNVTMISGKFLGRQGGTTANAIKAVDYFTDLKTLHNLNIVATNNSWGGGGFSQALLDAINRGGDAGILFVAAAGNGGSDVVGDNNDAPATPSYPSNYQCTTATDTSGHKTTRSWDCVIAVAAIDNAGQIASFSNYGATTVDLGAPGVGVLSTTASNTYYSYSGTSMATPHVTGAAALLAAAATTGQTAAQIKDAILSSAAPTASLSGKTVTGGRLNAGTGSAGSTGASSSTGGDTVARSVTLTKGAKKGTMTDVTVTWTGFTGDTVHVTRGGSTFSTENDQTLTETWRGSGTVTYTVCQPEDPDACASGSITI